jgi:2-polyprenyl-6-methoxyphenol hydroxylase-like FAD-dependent oxidoreductase
VPAQCIDPLYRRAVASLDELGEPDLIVGADGANSLVRNTFAAEFGTTLSYLNNRFAWFGTTRRFETLTQTFRASPLGHFNAHHYRYSTDVAIEGPAAQAVHHLAADRR